MAGLFDAQQIINQSVTADKLDNGIWLEIPIASTDNILSNDLNGLRATVLLDTDGSDIVLYGKNNTELSRINIATGTLESGYYDSATNEIVLVLSTGDEIRIPAADLVDEYTAGDYIDIDQNNEISVNIDSIKDELNLSGYISDSSNFVTLTDSQIITGPKIFVSSASFNGIGPNSTTANIGSVGSRFANIYATNSNNLGYVSSGGRTTTTDGITGAILSTSGNIHLCSSSDNAGIYFQPNNVTQNITFIAGYANDIKTNKSFLPYSGGALNLGSSTLKWDHTYTSLLFTGSKTADGDGLDGVIIGNSGNIVLTSTTTPTIFFQQRNATTLLNFIRASSDGSSILVSNNWGPVNSTELNLGSTTNRWDSIYGHTLWNTGNVYTNGKTSSTDGASGVILGGGNMYLQEDAPTIFFYRGTSTSSNIYIQNSSDGNLLFNAHIIPTPTNSKDIGSASSRWRNIYGTNSNNSGYISTGGKTSQDDGNSGVFANVSGNLFLTGSINANPGLYWLRNGETNAYTASIINNGSNVLSITASLIPSSSGFYSLGSAVTRWSNIFTGELICGVGGKAAHNDGKDGIAFLSNGNIVSTGYGPGIYWRLTNNTSNSYDGYIQNIASQVLVTNSTLRPVINNTNDLGATEFRWRNIYAINANFTGSVSAGGFVPISTAAYDLGSSTNVYRNIYVDGVNFKSLKSTSVTLTTLTGVNLNAGYDLRYSTAANGTVSFSTAATDGAESILSIKNTGVNPITITIISGQGADSIEIEAGMIGEISLRKVFDTIISKII